MEAREIAKLILYMLMDKTVQELEAEEMLCTLFENSTRVNEKEIPPLDMARLWKIQDLDGVYCFYCGEFTVPMFTSGRMEDYNATVDHILPKSRGGVDHIDNCVISCYKCNYEKGSLSLLPPHLSVPKNLLNLR